MEVKRGTFRYNNGKRLGIGYRTDHASKLRKITDIHILPQRWPMLKVAILNAYRRSDTKDTAT